MTPLIAAIALGYLAAMVVTGAQPEQRQLVRFEAKGVLKTAPERIRRVEVSRGSDRIAFVRMGEKRWATPDGVVVSAETGRRISMAVQMLHTSGPARAIPAEELADVDMAAFGLEPPRIVASLFEAGADPALTVRFGGRNPDEFLQYMRVDGDRHLYLVSRFVGEEWEAAAGGTLRE